MTLLREPQAKAIDKRHNKQCDICLCIDVDKAIKWHLYKEGFSEEYDKYVCGKCHNELVELRKKCHQKMDNPKHDIFKDYVPWFIPTIPGMVEAFRQNVEGNSLTTGIAHG